MSVSSGVLLTVSDGQPVALRGVNGLGDSAKASRCVADQLGHRRYWGPFLKQDSGKRMPEAVRLWLRCPRAAHQPCRFLLTYSGGAGSVVDFVMAERQGFEPWIEFPLYTLSKRAPSATRPSLRGALGEAHFHSIRYRRSLETGEVEPVAGAGPGEHET